MNEIDLATFTEGKVRNLTGHERGQAAREYYNLDSLDDYQESYVVLVPDNLDAITTSFFQGMFAKSVRRFDTQEEFLVKFRFNASPTILEQIVRGIDRVRTKRGSAFS